MGKHFKTTPKMCMGCGESYGKSPKETHEHWGKRKYCSQKCIMVGRRGAITNHWLGDKVGYGGIHQWLIKYYGKANECEGIDGIICKDNGGYEWACLHEKGYSRNREHFKMLCKCCHRKYDHTEPWNKGHHAKPIGCEFCGLEFIPAVKTRCFCSNSCSSKGKLRERLKTDESFVSMLTARL